MNSRTAIRADRGTGCEKGLAGCLAVLERRAPIERAVDSPENGKVVEETKSAGLLNRLIAEKNRPQADVFWSGDPVRAAILKTRGVSTPYRSSKAEGIPTRFSDLEGYWTGFSARARVLIYNRSLVLQDGRRQFSPAARLPCSFFSESSPPSSALLCRSPWCLHCKARTAHQ